MASEGKAMRHRRSRAYHEHTRQRGEVTLSLRLAVQVVLMAWAGWVGGTYGGLLGSTHLCLIAACVCYLMVISERVGGDL